MQKITYIDRHGGITDASYSLIKLTFMKSVNQALPDEAIRFVKAHTGINQTNALSFVQEIQNIQRFGTWNRYLPKEHLLSGMLIYPVEEEVEECEPFITPDELFMYG